MIAIQGQLSIFDLLEPTPKREAPHNSGASYELPTPCPACGEESPSGFMVELNHCAMPSDRQKFGHEVCVSMSLKLNHLHHAIARAGRKWDEDASCCWSKSDLHGKAVKKATREQWLDHARDEYKACLKLWALHMPSLEESLTEFLEAYGVTREEFSKGMEPVKPKQPPFRVSICVWQDTRCGWCGTTSTIGGFATRHPEHGDVSIYGEYCRRCNDKHGGPRTHETELIINLDPKPGRHGGHEEEIAESIRAWEAL